MCLFTHLLQVLSPHRHPGYLTVRLLGTQGRGIGWGAQRLAEGSGVPQPAQGQGSNLRGMLLMWPKRPDLPCG